MTSSVVAPIHAAASPAQSLPRHHTIWALLALLFLNYVGNFSHYAAFGLYEDDYLFTLPVFTWSPTDWWQRVTSFITTWPQGRPLWWILNDTLSFAVSRLDSLPFLYVIAFLSSSCCLLVLYRFLRRFLSEPASFLATAFYGLYPVANAKVIFMHQICFFWVPMLILLLFLQYFQGRYVWFFLGSLVVLLTYEPYFLVLPFSPLLSLSQPWRRRVREWLVTSCILAGFLFAILVLRHLLGDSRASTLLDDPAELGRRAMAAPWIGLLTTLKTSIVFPLDALMRGKAALFIEGLLALLIAYAVLRAPYPTGERVSSQPSVFFSHPGWLLLAGAAMFLSPYLYRFIPDYYPPIVDIGRLSMLHFPSAIGAALFIGAALDFLLQRLPKLKQVTLLFCAGYAALLVVFANHIQRSEYARSWRMQRDFAQNVIEQTRDLGDGDIAIVDIETGFGDGVDARPTTPGFPVLWIPTYLTEFLKLLNQYPIDWQRPPRLFGFLKDLPATIQGDTVFLETPPWQPAAHQARIRDGKFAWLEWVGGRLVRRQEPVKIAGMNLTPKPFDEKASIPPPTNSALMYFNRNDSSWPSMQRAINYPH